MDENTMKAVEGSAASLAKAISMALGYDVGYMKIERIQKSNGEVYLRCESDPINGSALGIMGFAVKNVRVGTFSRINDKAIDSTGPWFELHVSYEMQGGGTNGASLGVGGNRLIAMMNGAEWFVRITR